MIAVCKDKSYTFRSELTLDKEYEVIRFYDDPYAGYSMVDIINDEGQKHPYRANRFNLKWFTIIKYCAVEGGYYE